MGEKVCDVENGIVFVFTYTYINLFAVCLNNNTVKGEGKCYPLILLDAAIVVCLEECKVVVFGTLSTRNGRSFVRV